MFKKKDEIDYRAEFANYICKLLVDKHGSPEEAVKHFEEASIHLHENVRNIYELISSEIPLMALYDLKHVEPDDCDYTQEEHDNEMKITLQACEKYYK
jgi:hypothetical protein